MVFSEDYKKKGFDDRIVRYSHIHKVTQDQYDHLLSAIDPKETDVIFEGCAGYGDVTKHILDMFSGGTKKPEVYILDESKSQVDIAKREISIPDDHILLGDIRSTGFEDNTFDKVVIKMGVHELPKSEQKKVFSEMYRILKPGGKFIIWELCLNKDNQELFQDIVRKKDKLAGFDALVESRYFQRFDELQSLFLETGFQNVSEEYRFSYVFDAKTRSNELVSKERLDLLKDLNQLSAEQELFLETLGNKKAQELADYIRKVIPDSLREAVGFNDLGDNVEISVDKIIMSGVK